MHKRKQIDHEYKNELGLRRFLKPKIIREWTYLWKEKGFRGFVQEKGWKIFAVIVLFYLIRDSFLYIILPMWAGRSLLGC